LAFKEIIICEKGSQAKIFAKYFKLTQQHIVRGERTVYYDHKDGIAVAAMSGHLLEFMPPEFYNPGLKKENDGWSLKSLPVIPQLNQWKMQPKKSGPPKKVKRDNALLDAIKWALVTNGQPAEISLAMDNDKEGELLGWEVLEYFGMSNHPNISRLLYSSINEKMMVEAYNNKSPGSDWYKRYLAGLARAYADWLVGMNLTIALTAHNKDMLPRFYPLNSGRVIYAIIYLIKQRHDEIVNFVPRDYFSEQVTFVTKDGDDFVARAIYPERFLEPGKEQKMFNKEAAEKIHKYLLSGKKVGVIEAFDESKKSQGPPTGYDRNSFDRHMIKKHGMSLEDITKALQNLYSEKGLITYPRVDVKHLDKDKHHPKMPDHISAIMANLSSSPQLSDKEKTLYERAGKLLDTSRKSGMFKSGVEDKEAHHAIIPTDSKANLAQLTNDEFLVYRELCDRLLVQFLPNYEYSSTKVIVDVEGKIKCQISGTTPLRKGWKGLGSDPLEKKQDDEGTIIPLMKVGDSVSVSGSETVVKTTVSPKYYTEGELLKDMNTPTRFVKNKELLRKLKKITIGTSATQSVHVTQLGPKGFIVKEKEGKGKKAPEYLKPTRKLLAVSEVAPDYIKLPEVSAYWEETFNDIFEGKTTLESFYARQVKLLHRFFEEINAGGFKLTSPAVDSYKTCECGGFLFFQELKKKKFNLWSCGKCDSAYFDEDGKVGSKLGAKGSSGPADDAPRLPCPLCKGEAYHKELPGKNWSLWKCLDCDESFFDDKGSIGKQMKKK
jgi:DNA topoisomerase-3